MFNLLDVVIEQLPSPFVHCSCCGGVALLVRDGDVDDEFGDDDGDRLSLDIADFFMVFMNLRQASQE